MNRRDWLTGTTALALLAKLGLLPSAAHASVGSSSPSTSSRLITSRRAGEHYEAVLLEPDGTLVATRRLPDRGHSFAISSTRRHVVAFGRQPGFYAYVLDATTLALRQEITPNENRHFFGHGVFSTDDRYFYATENDYEQGRGVIGVYAVDESGRFHRVTEWSTQGIGPHEVILTPDGKTLCVANGGLLTHPDYGKHPLNLAEMRPSLAYLDLATGTLREQVFLPEKWHKLSIRHLAMDAQQRVWVGCQYMGSRGDDVPVVGVHTAGSALEMMWGPDALRREMRHYVGSMAASSDGQLVAASSPVGGRVVIWDTNTMAVRDSLSYADVCGIAALGPTSFLASSGTGEVQRIEPGGHVSLRHVNGTAWDNHIRAL